MLDKTNMSCIDNPKKKRLTPVSGIEELGFPQASQKNELDLELVIEDFKPEEQAL